MQWSTSCKDWESRIVERRSLIPFAPLFPDEAEAALAVFKSLRVVDLPGQPTFGECCEEWVFDFVRAIFGAYDAEAAKRLISEFFLCVAKKNGKSTVAAGIMVTALIRNWRHSASLLILAPTIEVANNSFGPAASMVRADEELNDLLHIQDSFRQITHRLTRATLKVVAADTDTVGGTKAGFVLVDELWLFGKRANADKMLGEALGGLVSRPEGFVIFLSTQSDNLPAGVFKERLDEYRDIRDGKIENPRKLGVIYEFPSAMIEAEAYLLAENFYITNPNIGYSVHADWLREKLAEAQRKGQAELTTFLAKHLNVEIGNGLRADRWAGADFWIGNKAKGFSNVDRTLDLDRLLERSEVVVVGIDGGGLDDLLGFSALGRERESGRWLLWCHAWASRIVLERRKSIATELLEFEKAGELTIVDLPGEDVEEIVDIVARIEEAGLLAEINAVGVDAAGIGDVVDALTSGERAIELPIGDEPLKRIVPISQGWRLNGAIKTTERKLAAGGIRHNGSRLMTWCAGNAKAEPKGNAVSITKAASGTAKIDPLMAVFDAVSLMALNPEAAGVSVYETIGAESADDGESDASILENPTHPRWQEARERFEATLGFDDED